MRRKRKKNRDYFVKIWSILEKTVIYRKYMRKIRFYRIYRRFRKIKDFTGGFSFLQEKQEIQDRWEP